MARLTKIDRLPASIKDEIGALRRAGHTIDQILAHLRGLGVEDVSRTGLGEHVKSIDEIGQEMRRERAMAEALVAGLGEVTDDKLARLNVELAQGAVMKLQLALRERGADLDPAELELATRAMKNISTTAKIDVERTEKIEAGAAAKAKREAADAAGAAMSERGMTRDTIDAIKSRILGVKKG
jgi:hypothetical protein